jgi:hypothetical protein
MLVMASVERCEGTTDILLLQRLNPLVGWGQALTRDNDLARAWAVNSKGSSMRKIKIEDFPMRLWS